MVSLMGEALATQQLAYSLGEELGYVRSQLVRMHHLGLVMPIAVREEDFDADVIGYFRNLIWTLTDHTRHHRELIPGCNGCRIRESFIAGDAFYE